MDQVLDPIVTDEVAEERASLSSHIRTNKNMLKSKDLVPAPGNL